jgi:dienelactone hydrolase
MKKIILLLLLPVFCHGQTLPDQAKNISQKLIGDYECTDHRVIVIGKTQKQLFALFENSGQLRGLNKIDNWNWTAGTTVISANGTQHFQFDNDHLKITEPGKEPILATRKKCYTEKEIIFKNTADITLAGTLFIPLKPNGKGIILVHGSGAQDRNGSNSCIRFLADDLCRKGLIVLTYDKQGVGSSQGDWSKMKFTELAGDALAARGFLKSVKTLRLSKIGMGGYSQAGWVMARAIEKQPGIDFILALSTAGSGITVAEQNIYDVKTQMECAGKYSAEQIALIHRQQDLFFDYINTRKNGQALDDLTGTISKDSILKEWKDPSTQEIDFNNRSEWFNALEVGFNPLPIWKGYKNQVLVVLSAFDDSTPAALVKQRITGLHNSHIQVRIIKNAQHIGLMTTSVCNAKAAALQKLSPDYFNAIHSWIGQLQ